MHRFVPFFAVMLLIFVPLAAEAAEWLPAGVHEKATTRAGISCTLVVPSAVSEGKPMPVLFVLAPDGLPDAKRWQEWGEHRGCVVVGITGFRWSVPIAGGRWAECVKEAEAVYGAVLTVVKGGVPVHGFMRFITGSKGSMAMAVAITQQAKEEFGGLMLAAPAVDATAEGELRADVPVVFVLGSGSSTRGAANKVADRLVSDGGTVKIATVDDLGDEDPAIDVHTRAMDWLMNISRATHKRFTPKERRTNLEQIAEQAQELPGLVNPAVRRECAGFLMSVPGMDKLRREYERLGDVWLESTVEMVKEVEKKDVVEAHETLSVILKGERWKTASPKGQRAAQAELTRMRKNPAVKDEIAAFDLVADTCAMLDHDASLAKQRIALKDLQGVLAQYPKTHAAKTAADLVGKIQQNLR